jgi:hypothetical protein
MFPDLTRLERNQPTKGKVFTVSRISVDAGVGGRSVSVDFETWEACLECQHYRGCMDLGTAKMALFSALSACA